MQYSLIGEKVQNEAHRTRRATGFNSRPSFVYYLHEYMNNLSLSQKKSNVILYADDTVVRSRSSASEIVDDHDKALDNVNDWLIKNKLTLNKEKTKSMLFVKQNQKNVVSRTFIKK